ncbi:lipoprotein [Candidatus Venteria ishoeyi]|uniref:LPS translocon maturation chaperone LptM n=1 Tax=Candidatus Venteria ishoeyi TaxID=1899563 RepID=UPI0025A5750F|nr:lipoprotein [Candidatus Venteria ishoeyi]MDM8546641.1 lipoprotein [Candidatus Venteria ishoeyi]
MPLSRLFFLFLCLLSFTLTACGQKGPLYLPQAQAEAQTETRPDTIKVPQKAQTMNKKPHTTDKK